MSESKAESALSLAVAALGDRGEGVGAEYPDDPEHAGTHIVTQYMDLYNELPMSGLLLAFSWK